MAPGIMALAGFTLVFGIRKYNNVQIILLKIHGFNVNANIIRLFFISEVESIKDLLR